MATPKSSLEDLVNLIKPYHQSHLIQWWDELNDQQQTALASQIQTINFEQLQRLSAAEHSEITVESPARKAERATPPGTVIRLQNRDENSAHNLQAVQAGNQLLSEGKVGAILVAGGQGTRLGFNHPKGMYPIGPVKQTSLFQMMVEQLLARSRNVGKPICYFIMTSDATHDDTVAYFKENQNFGLQTENLYFFQQGTMPAVDADSGQILLEEKYRIAVSPDGHGGTLAALKNSGLFDIMREKGIEYLYYHQVDNPTAIICDPEFLGYHLHHQAEVSVKVVAKRSADEKMGIVCEVDQKTQIIEYSDLPENIAEKTDSENNLLHWAGSTAIHIFNRTFLEKIANDDSLLPFHQANKKVPFLDASGNQTVPETPNAIKFERFIFDVLPVAESVLVYEIDRQREFNPLKNAEGQDSPQTVQAALSHIYSQWLISCGIEVPTGTTVEISPLMALDEIELKTKISLKDQFTGPIYLGE